MQKPVIQRIKRRVEVCQSLPVTCGRRGNDTGNGLVTVVSLQCAVDCYSENGKSPHSKPFTFLLLSAAKCRSGMFFTLCAPYVRNPDTGQRCDNRQRRQDARPCQRQHDAPLCEGSRLVNHARHGGRRRKHGVVARCRTCEVCKGHPAPFPEFRPILRAGSGNRSPVNNKVYYGMQTD